MVAATVTVWVLFAFWIGGPHVGLPRAAARTAGGLLALELVALLGWSYGIEGCAERGCAPLARTAGVAARADVPVLAALFVVFCVVQVRRRGLSA